MWDELRELSPAHVLDVADRVWLQRELFIRWPKRAFTFMPGLIRQARYHHFTDEQRAVARHAKVRIDARSNGPAIMAFLIAGGERPARVCSNHGSSIHHIYDGKFPAPGRSSSVRAVKDGRYFTASQGLVAIHPIAEALADEVPFFTWLLRHEAYRRFRFDPDDVFSNSSVREPYSRP